jgi:hypothetical protein
MSAEYQNSITKDSIPVYGKFFDYWDQTDWIVWHSAMVQAYGHDTANITLIKAMQDAPFLSTCLGFTTWLPTNANDAFISYANANGFYDAITSGLNKDVQAVAGLPAAAADITKNVADATKQISGAVDKVAAAANDSGKFLFYFAVAVIIGVGLFMLRKRKLI